jgi:hypothetical protein
MATQLTAERRGTGTFVRVSVALQTAAIFFQAITAGIMLGTHHGEVLHSVGARVMFAASVLYVLAAVLGWKPGGGAPRPIWYAVGFLALAGIQVVLGINHVLVLHVPLGILMFGMSMVLLAQQLCRRFPRPRS